MNKIRLTTVIDKYAINPVVKALSRAGVTLPGVVILETTGNRTGRIRRVPVGGRRDGDSIWIVAEHGRRNAYVRNIDANPHVKAKLRGRWHPGTANLLPDDDPEDRLRKMVKGTLGLRLIEGVTRLTMTEPITVRIDLDQE